MIRFHPASFYLIFTLIISSFALLYAPNVYAIDPNYQKISLSSGYIAKNGIIYDNGKPIFIVGVNWFGFETRDHVVHGLWARNWEDIMEQIVELGFNGLRIPVCPTSIHGATVRTINYDLNPDLVNLTSLEILDKILNKAEELGLYFILDMHRIGCDYIEELWYNDTYPEENVISDLVFLAKRYSHLHYFLGIDIKNEPHGKASWGTGDNSTDFRLFAERAGTAILDANPNLLIFVEGVEKTHIDEIDGQNQYPCFWGENLMGVKKYPVRLPEGKIVYSSHVYGPSVYNMSYFFDTSFPENLPSIWDLHFGYIRKENIGTIAIGEWGGRYIGMDKIWQDKFAKYLKDRKIFYFFYWSLNPNSGDTGGILQDDWKSVNEDKLNLLMDIKKFYESAIEEAVNTNNGEFKLNSQYLILFFLVTIVALTFLVIKKRRKRKKF